MVVTNQSSGLFPAGETCHLVVPASCLRRACVVPASWSAGWLVCGLTRAWTAGDLPRCAWSDLRGLIKCELCGGGGCAPRCVAVVVMTSGCACVVGVRLRDVVAVCRWLVAGAPFGSMGLMSGAGRYCARAYCMTCMIMVTRVCELFTSLATLLAGVPGVAGGNAGGWAGSLCPGPRCGPRRASW